MSEIIQQSKTWPAIVIGDYSRDVDEALFHSEVAVAILPGVLSVRERALLNRRLDDLAAASYGEGHEELAVRGPRQWQAEQKFNREWYFAEAEHWEQASQELYLGTSARTEELLAILATGTPRLPGRAHGSDGRLYASSTVLTLGNGADRHYDRAAEDGPGWEIASACQQLGANTYLRNDGGGGDLTVWRRQGHPHPEAPGNYGFPDEVVAGADAVIVRPAPGDTILFDTGNYHQVAPAATPDGRRAISNFIGRATNGSTFLWA